MKLNLNKKMKFFFIVFMSTAAAGCGYLNIQETTKLYSPSDGINTDIGNAKFRNLVIVAKDKISPGRLLGVIENVSDKEISININYKNSKSINLIVPANSILNLNNETNKKLIEPYVNVQPGSLIELHVNTDEINSNIELPILDGTLHEYIDYLPTD